jgi:quinol monooxygenase YgiN
MFMRLLQLKINLETLSELRRIYSEQIIPELQQVAGCRFACLIQSAQQEDECLSLTLWDTPTSAETYERSGKYQKLVGTVKPFLSDSSEWRIQLSQDLTLEYKPVETEPVVKSYAVGASTDAIIPSQEKSSLMFLRLVSAKVQPGKLEELRHLYTNVVIPALLSVKGCHYAYLIENTEEKNEAISLTIWDSQQDAENYERSGLFDELTDKIKHTLSTLFQ